MVNVTTPNDERGNAAAKTPEDRQLMFDFPAHVVAGGSSSACGTLAGQRTSRKTPYVQSQLVLPLLTALRDSGGCLSAQDAYEAVGEALSLSVADRTEKTAKGNYIAFARDLRWARQRAVVQGFIRTPSKGLWEITGAGKSSLRMAKPGIIVTIYEDEDGVALWADCKDAFAHVESESVSLILTSPPYPLLRPKQYQRGSLDLAESEYLDWITDLAADWKRVLRPDGSLVLNLGDCWQKGRPTQSLYVERLLIRLADDLGYSLSQRFEWHNPAKMPAPAEWVNVKRVRVTSKLERLLWLSKSENPYADNRQVLVPYSDSMKRLIAAGGQSKASRPSGYEMKGGAFSRDNGGAIPSNLIVSSNTSSNSSYQRACREMGLPVHPARFPADVPAFFIKMLTRPGQWVADPFGGSLKTAAAAQKLGRRFITCEKSLDYALGGLTRIGGHVPADLLEPGSV